MTTTKPAISVDFGDLFESLLLSIFTNNDNSTTSTGGASSSTTEESESLLTSLLSILFMDIDKPTNDNKDDISFQSFLKHVKIVFVSRQFLQTFYSNNTIKQQTKGSLRLQRFGSNQPNGVRCNKLKFPQFFVTMHCTSFWSQQNCCSLYEPFVKTVNSVFGARIRTHNFLVVSLLP